MYFKLFAKVKPLHLNEDESISVIVADEGDSIGLVLERLNKDDSPGLYKPGWLKCTAIIELELDERLICIYPLFIVRPNSS